MNYNEDYNKFEEAWDHIKEAYKLLQELTADGPPGFTLQEVWDAAYAEKGKAPVAIMPSYASGKYYALHNVGNGFRMDDCPPWLTDALPLPLFDWPEGAEWVAMDKTGHWAYYGNKPKALDNIWGTRFGGVMDWAAYTPWLPAAGMPFECTLIKRPEGV